MSMDASPDVEVSVADARRNFADLLYRAAAGRTTYITTHGRRIAAVVPLIVAENASSNELSRP